MSEGNEPRILAEGRFLRLAVRDGWEFATRQRGVRAVVAIVAITDAREIVLVEQHRRSVERRVIELPAGLVGDEPGHEHEPIADAARRELLEETGFDAREWRHVGGGPPSCGMSDEVVDIYLATGLSRIGEGGGVAGEDIRVHVVPLAEADAWLRARMAEGLMVDPKTWAGLFFAGSAPAAPGQAERDRLP